MRLAALATILLTFYGLTAISRHDIAPPSSSRYLTVGVVFLLLMLVEAARGWRIRVWVPFVVLALVWVSFGKADGNADAIRDGRALFLQRSDRVRASLGAVELLGRQRVAPTLEIAPLAAPFLEAGPWFDALDGLRGDPGDSPAELIDAPGDARAFADDTLMRAGGLQLQPVGAGGAVAFGRARCTPLQGAIVPRAGVRVEATASNAADAARAPLRRGLGDGRRPADPGGRGRRAASAARRLSGALRDPDGRGRNDLPPRRVVASRRQRVQTVSRRLPSARRCRPASR